MTVLEGWALSIGTRATDGTREGVVEEKDKSGAWVRFPDGACTYYLWAAIHVVPAPVAETGGAS